MFLATSLSLGLSTCSPLVLLQPFRSSTPMLVAVMHGISLPMCRERKNMNLPGVVVDLPTLTSKDEDDLVNWGVPNDIDFIAASFVRKASDIEYIRKVCSPDTRCWLCTLAAPGSSPGVGSPRCHVWGCLGCSFCLHLTMQHAKACHCPAAVQCLDRLVFAWRRGLASAAKLAVLTWHRDPLLLPASSGSACKAGSLPGRRPR